VPYLIVHADDFGLCEKVNEGILEAHLYGILTSTSIMANGAGFNHAASICNSTPTLDVGVHLTLVEEKPILNTFAVSSLINDQGRFHSHAIEFTKRYLTARICLQQVRRELDAQIQRVINHGINVSHLDSHQHLHMLPKILAITIDLAKKYDIPAIRVPNEMLHANFVSANKSLTRLMCALILKLLCCIGRYRDLFRTDYFVGFQFSGNMNKKNLYKVLEHIPPSGTCEIMCHPGSHDQQTPYSHWGYNWLDELTALKDPEISALVRRKRIHLTSYGQLFRL